VNENLGKETRTKKGQGVKQKKGLVLRMYRVGGELLTWIERGEGEKKKLQNTPNQRSIKKKEN